MVVDYSCPEGAGDWVEANYPSARVVRVPGQTRWHASAARNIGVRHVDAPWICFVDSDVVLESGFGAVLLSTVKPGGFYRVWSTDRGLVGTFACARSDFDRVGGYDEIYPCWGEEDNDLYDALEFVGVEPRPLPSPLPRHLPHGNDQRTRFSPIPDLQLGHAINRVYRIVKWNTARLNRELLTLDMRRALVRQGRRGRDGFDPDRPARRPGDPPPVRDRPRRLVAVAAAHLPPDQGHLKARRANIMISVPQAFDSARKHYQAGRLQEAEQLCRQVVQTDANHIDALHLLGLIAARTGRDDLALDYLEAAVRLKPDFAEAHNILGIVLVKQRKLAEAVDRFRQALRAQPDHAMAHGNLGNALREQGDLDAAVASFREAVRLKPDFAEAYNNLGSVLQQQGQLEEAEACLRQALRLRPDYAEVAYNLGILHGKLGRVDEAIACNQQAVRLKPDHAEAHLNLGLGLMGRGQLDEAIAIVSHRNPAQAGRGPLSQ